MNPTAVDALLQPYLQAASEAEAQAWLTALMAEQAEPLLQTIVARKLEFSSQAQPDEAADVRSEIILQLLHRLHAWRRDPAAFSIADFKAYVAVTSFRACAAYLRRRYPQRAQLLNRVHYLLTHQPQFGLWQTENEEWLAGLADWANDLLTRQSLSPARVSQLLAPALPPPLRGMSDATFRQVSAAEQVAAIFHWAGQFVALDDLVQILAHWWGVQERILVPAETISWQVPASLNPATQIEQRLYLQKLWQEIQSLPVRQRRALLLNLRSAGGHSALVFFPVLQIASVRQLASGMEMAAEALAEVWHQLPLDDAQLAVQMNVTPRQVVNLRKAARARLLRKTRDW